MLPALRPVPVLHLSRHSVDVDPVQHGRVEGDAGDEAEGGGGRARGVRVGD